MIATRAADCQATVAYVNAVGANDGLVFDGGGFVGARTARPASTRRRVSGRGVEAVTPRPSTAPGASAPRNTTWREDQEAFAAPPARRR